MAKLYLGSTLIGSSTSQNQTLSFTAAQDGDITSVTIPSGTVSLCDYLFHGMGITSFTMPNTIKTIGEYLFGSCTKLTSVTLSTGISALPRRCFYQCWSLPQITIPANIKTINDGCFVACSALKKVYFAGDPPTLNGTGMSAPFYNIENATFYYKSGNTKWTSSIRTATYGGSTGTKWATY